MPRVDGKARIHEMCSHYEAPLRKLLQSAFPSASVLDAWDKPDMWPGYIGPFLRRSDHASVGDDAVPPLEVLTGNFGLLPLWAKDESLAKRTYNARSETVSEKPAFKNAWRWAQHCIIPATAIYEPDWRSGKAIATRITRADDEVLGIAGLYERRSGADGGWAFSFTMLTLNANGHPIFKELHRSDPKRPPEMQDKRMVAILPRGLYDAWLDAPAERSIDFMRQFPADRLMAKARLTTPESTG
ncbi:SOS response-associated peptidase [Xylophilus sp. GOD-11R]|uniref:SOS response-associated peptidase n=1 Tax=Xylophilus sp. GOD-11R TaxID=3089814 RepID=UPI00298CAD62|nr:SOS response-associated peptidase family protein [Xylophilus sp. GOD-11R]WPB58666.1 SOS response-associated peptidase family protein [Xylophilus sp. GOD-11R]